MLNYVNSSLRIFNKVSEGAIFLFLWSNSSPGSQSGLQKCDVLPNTGLANSNPSYPVFGILIGASFETKNIIDI